MAVEAYDSESMSISIDGREVARRRNRGRGGGLPVITTTLTIDGYDYPLLSLAELPPETRGDRKVVIYKPRQCGASVPSWEAVCAEVALGHIQRCKHRSRRVWKRRVSRLRHLARVRMCRSQCATWRAVGQRVLELLSSRKEVRKP